MTDKQKEKQKEVEEIVNRLKTEFEQEQTDADEIAEEGIKHIVAQLAKENIKTVGIWFDGSGDSGSIDDIEYNGTSPNLRQEIEDWAYEVLEGTGVDWYNNDGGYGSITIDVENNTYSFNVYQRYTESTCEASDTVEIG